MPNGLLGIGQFTFRVPQLPNEPANDDRDDDRDDGIDLDHGWLLGWSAGTLIPREASHICTPLSVA